MPNKPHAPRGGSSKKSVLPPEDTSFIVFGDGKSKKSKKGNNEVKPGESSKVKGKDSENSNDGKGKGKGKATDGQTEEAPKKPDTRTLIGGASWTGKLPVNIFNEYCQKQRWGKPDYKMHRDGDQYSSHVVLSKTNPKNQEVTTLSPIKLPPDYVHLARAPTAVEARNFAATYTLFRVASGKSMHNMLPPTYKDLWKGVFTELKKKDETEGNAWMYEADPFLAQKEREKAKELAQKEREKKIKEREAAAKNPQPGMPGGASGGGVNRMRGWERVPKIELGKRTRKEIERLVRRDAVWNPHDIRMTGSTLKHTIDEITKMGFRRSHVEEAAMICKDREEILEWLLIHVPEDDLPAWSLPEGYSAGVSMASSDLKREGAIKRLASAGYSVELCEEAYDRQGGDEAKAAAILQVHLIHPMKNDEEPAKELANMLHDVAIGEEDTWEEEQTTLEAIYDTRYERPIDTTARIQLELTHAKKPIILQVRKPLGLYPNVPPIITIEAPALPAYIRLSIIRQAFLFAESDLLGMQMIFNIVDWLEENIPKIIERPGRLTDVSSAVAAADVSATPASRSSKAKSRPRNPVDWRQGTPENQRLLADFQAKQQTSLQKKMMVTRQNLPAWRLRDAIVKAVSENQVCIISGETGSGKSTQSVQFILDDLIQRQLGRAANIICTQPRRISALGLADRVADERCSAVGDEIGYAIRGESKQKAGITKITFVTTGVLLRRLQTSGGSSDDVLAAVADVSHIVVDEVHERSLDTDFLLVLLRDILRRRKDLKVILMSATLDANVFEAYFSEAGTVGRVEIEGRTYPVDDFYIDDVVRFTNSNNSESDSMPGALRELGMGINYDLIAKTVQYIDRQLGEKEGGILIFLPGTMEIDRTIQALRQLPNLHALPLHASLLPIDQKRVFPPAPPGRRKVIASTNVAETSITIEDIVAVIDTGRVKETSYDPATNMVKLAEKWASRAACKQRRGRAGRVRAGQCFKLYTRNAEAKMLERPEPEIRRVPLEQLCLSVKGMGVHNVPSFLAGALTPPESTAVEGAIDLLTQMGALTDNELTALGRHLSMIPADLRIGKLLVYGSIFGCLEASLIIAGILSTRSPFISPRDRNEETRAEFNAIRASFAASQGDLITDLRAYEAWDAMRKKGVSGRDTRQWCAMNMLNQQTLFDISSNRAQYLSALKEISFIPTSYSSASFDPTNSRYNAHNANDKLLRALVAGSFNPQIARIQLPDKKFAAGISGAVELDPEARAIKYFANDGRVFVHPSSALFSSNSNNPTPFPTDSSFIAYFNKMATSKVFIRDLTPFNSYTLLMFGGDIAIDKEGRGLVVDGWVRLRGWARIGVLIGRLRGMVDGVLSKLVREPGIAIGREGEEVLGVVRGLVELAGLDN